VQRLETSRKSAATEGGRLRTRALEAIRDARDEALEGVGLAPKTAARGRDPVPGDRVRVGDLGVIADVVAVHDDALDLAVSGKRLRAPKDAVTLVGGPAGRTFPAGVKVSRATEAAVPAEINLVGLTVDEALPRVDKLLDEAVLAEHHEIRVIHGFGQGKLRQAVAQLLNGHPHVSTYRAGSAREGGGGVTVVELKD
jgi:DNA mismatch repair protein MutS2